MANVVQICNAALAHLGDGATISSIDPPEGSAQAEHCQTFYPLARDSLLEMHAWGFATKRASLSQYSTNPTTAWAYAYAVPSDSINLIAILASDAADDLTSGLDIYSEEAAGTYFPQPFVSETLTDGRQVIYTNQESAVLRYVASVTDPAQFSPLFTLALSWHLASLLAGPIIKGDQGAAEAKRCAAMVQSILAPAKESDANDRRLVVAHSVPWFAGR